MYLYFSGNFPVMSSPEKEKKLMELVLKEDVHYCRLVSFFFEKGMSNLLKMKEEEEENGSQS